MPWKERTVMSEKMNFVAQAMAGEESFSALCHAYNISRKTGYKWLDRVKCGVGLEELSRAPHSSPHRTPPEVEAVILAERDRHPSWGPRKLERVLHNHGYQNIPCKSTIENILKRNDRIEPEDSEAATPFRRFQRERPNDLWQMDFKGDFAMLDGKRCYPLTITDDCTRFCLCLHASSGTNYEEFFPVLNAVFEEYGLPSAILCDNGKPWGDSRAGITGFDVRMMRLGILPIHGRPLHPQTQGKEERFHRTMQRELLRARTFENLADAQEAFTDWRQEYNCERPHEALNLDVPNQHYRCSRRSLKEADRPVEYPTGARLRKINYKGYLSIQRHQYYITETLAGEHVELAEVEDHLIALRYGDFEFAQIDLEQQMIVSKRRRRVR